VTLILEIKGYEDDLIKPSTMRPALGGGGEQLGQLGRWMFHVCRNPQLLAKELSYLSRPREHAS